MHPAEAEIPSPARPTLVKVMTPFIVGAPYTDERGARLAQEGEIVAVEAWLAKDLIARGLAASA